MRVDVPVHLIDAKGSENDHGEWISPQLVHPQRNDENDFRHTVGQEIQRSEQPVAAQYRLRCAQCMHSDEIVRIVRNLMQEEQPDDRAHRGRMNKPKQQAADGFQRAIYTLDRDTCSKRVSEGSLAS